MGQREVNRDESSVRVFLLHEWQIPTASVPQSRHVAHWSGLGLNDYLGGPFEDRTGGLITFSTRDFTEAQRAVETDPFVLEGLVGSHWLKHWTPE